MSPYTNRRTDRYGGSMENRIEIVRQVVGQIRDQAGSDFAVIIKLNCDDGSSDDGTPEETGMATFPRIAKLVEKAGVDAIDECVPFPTVTHESTRFTFAEHVGH